MTQLEEKIKQAADKYYSGQSLDMSDVQFDTLVEKLKIECPESELLRMVGFGHVPKDRKVYHIGGRIGSLEKYKLINALPSEFKNSEVIITPKLDGLSGVLYIKNGKLDKAITRGDGKVGEDCTDKLLKILPKLNIKSDALISIAGEIIVDKQYEDFLKNRGHHSLRNLAAGVINRKEVTEDLKYLKFIPYSVRIANSYDFLSKIEMFNFIKDIGLSDEGFIVDPIIKTSFSEEELFELYNQFSTQYFCDGLVFTINNSISKTDNYFEENSVAYKFMGDTAVVKVDKINWAASYTGKIVPVIKLVSPIFLSGANIENISGYNKKFIVDNGIDSQSDIEIIRSGEIIPKVNKVVNSVSVILPDYCPSCGSVLQEEKVELKCINISCPAKSLAKLIRFTDFLSPVDRLGYSWVETFFNVMNILSVSEFILLLRDYSTNSILSEFQLRIKDSNISGMGVHIFNLLSKMVSILKNKLFGNDKFLYTDELLISIGIPSISVANAEKLSSIDLNDPWDLIMTNTNSLGISINVIASLSLNMSYIKDCISNITVLPRVTNKQVFKFTVAITGKISNGRERFTEELKFEGINVVNTINSKVSYLIINDKFSPKSKTKVTDATKYNIPIISEDEFRVKFMKKMENSNI